MPDRPESQRPQERDLTIDRWEKFPFKKENDPYENRSEDQASNQAPNSDKSQYQYEGWEKEAFPNKNVSETPAESVESVESDKKPSGGNK
jgi:hypothetical protein